MHRRVKPLYLNTTGNLLDCVASCKANGDCISVAYDEAQSACQQYGASLIDMGLRIFGSAGPTMYNKHCFRNKCVNNEICSAELVVFSGDAASELSQAGAFCTSFMRSTVGSVSTATELLTLSFTTTIATVYSSVTSTVVQSTTVPTTTSTTLENEVVAYPVTLTTFDTLSTTDLTTNIGTTTSTTLFASTTVETNIATTNLGTTTVIINEAVQTSTGFTATSNIGTTTLTTFIEDDTTTMTATTNVGTTTITTSVVTASSTTYVLATAQQKRTAAAIPLPSVWQTLGVSSLSQACSCVLKSKMPKPITSYTSTATTTAIFHHNVSITATSLPIAWVTSTWASFQPELLVVSTTTSIPETLSTETIMVTTDLTSTFSSDFPVTTTQTNTVTSNGTFTFSSDYPTTTTTTTTSTLQEVSTVSSDMPTTTSTTTLTTIITTATISSDTPTLLLQTTSPITTIAVAPSPLPNGNWESGSTDPWSVFDDSLDGSTIEIVSNPTPGDSHGNYWISSTAYNVETTTNVYQTNVAVTPSINYTLSFDYQCVNPDQLGAWVNPEVYVRSETLLHDVLLCSDIIAGVWYTYSGTFVSPDPQVIVIFNFASQDTGDNTEFYMDNAAITPNL